MSFETCQPSSNIWSICHSSHLYYTLLLSILLCSSFIMWTPLSTWYLFDRLDTSALWMNDNTRYKHTHDDMVQSWLVSAHWDISHIRFDRSCWCQTHHSWLQMNECVDHMLLLSVIAFRCDLFVDWLIGCLNLMVERIWNKLILASHSQLDLFVRLIFVSW